MKHISISPNLPTSPKQQKRLRYLEMDDELNSEETNLTTAPKYSGDANSSVSASSINTSILDDAEEVKVLKQKLEETQMRCMVLEEENEKNNNELELERKRIVKLEKKLQFVKDNQEVFMRLKEAYINMKYNEAAGRKMIEIREKGNQTWDGILCRMCIETEETRREIDNLMKKYSELFIVSPTEMRQLEHTVKYLKDLIERREKSWSLNMERENRLQIHISNLERENEILRQVMANKQDVDLPQIEATKSSEYSNKEVGQLKKIIVKFEKKFRELIEKSGGALKVSYPLNDKEKRIVQQLMIKYNSRLLQKKSIERLSIKSQLKSLKSDPNASVEDLANKIDDLVSDDVPIVKINIDGQDPALTEVPDNSAIMMMDYLFESESKVFIK